MTEITQDHVEWAVVSRMKRMLDEPAHGDFNVTQSYALFTAILCWVMQHIRIDCKETLTAGDKAANKLLAKLEKTSIAGEPWNIHTAPTARIVSLGTTKVMVPAPQGFEAHTAKRFLINLRNAVAHGDARIVTPFNKDKLLVGFTFSCSGHEKGEKWRGNITLLESDMRSIGSRLADIYCNAIRRDELNRGDGNFRKDANAIREVAA